MDRLVVGTPGGGGRGGRGRGGAAAGMTWAEWLAKTPFSEQAQKDTLEKIKARVLELMGEAARNQYVRNGSARRP